MPSVTEILNTVCNYYLVSPSMAVSKRRDDKYLKIRQMVCLLSEDKEQDIAFALNIYRSNVYWSRKAMLNRFETDKKLLSEYNELKTLINGKANR